MSLYNIMELLVHLAVTYRHVLFLEHNLAICHVSGGLVWITLLIYGELNPIPITDVQNTSLNFGLFLPKSTIIVYLTWLSSWPLQITLTDLNTYLHYALALPICSKGMYPNVTGDLDSTLNNSFTKNL